jgi:DNA invertase Pin-like site-specific DNA recombinase
MSNIHGYIRVSSLSQAESGLSLQQQEEVIRLRSESLAQQYGLEVGELHSDPAISATRHDLRDRPAGQKLDASLNQGDHVVIAKLDRAFRNQRDCVLTMEAWEKRGVSVHLLDLGVDTSTPAGKLVTGIMSAFAQWEAARIGERIRDAKKSMRANGKATNGIRRLGYQIDPNGHLLPYTHEREVATKIAKLRTRGLFWREIAERLNSDSVIRPGGFTGQRIAAWNAQACERLNSAMQADWP